MLKSAGRDSTKANVNLRIPLATFINLRSRVTRNARIPRSKLSLINSKFFRASSNMPTVREDVKPVFHLAIFSREQAKSECDWLVMSSVVVARQSSCFSLCSREQIPQVEKTGFINGPLYNNYMLVFISAGKCPAAPAAPLPGNFSQIFSQEISHFSQEIFVKIVPAKTEVYHHHKQNQTSLKSIYIVGRKFYL